MDLISVIALGAALSADAFAAAIVYGSSDRTARHTGAWVSSLFFGAFQAFMPILGWSIGKVGSRAVDGFDHIIACFILVFLGIKLILDSRNNSVEENKPHLDLKMLSIAAFATSIDALTAGIALPAAAGVSKFTGLVSCVLVIGLITFAVCFAGYYLGKKLSSLNPVYIQVTGGVMLVAIGVKTFVEGGCFG